ncbi:hypothetical protein IL306_009507 [Fusarium sp. DS 682]|nr:hypothetical protein IL306_009507 [Fusarium sp. DS 682]
MENSSAPFDYQAMLSHLQDAEVFERRTVALFPNETEIHQKIRDINIQLIRVVALAKEQERDHHLGIIEEPSQDAPEATSLESASPAPSTTDASSSGWSSTADGGKPGEKSYLEIKAGHPYPPQAVHLNGVETHKTAKGWDRRKKQKQSRDAGLNCFIPQNKRKR